MDGGEAARPMLVGSNCAKPIINPIMMRFRPIAPKPVAGGSVSGDTSESKNYSSVSKGRTKRKYVRVKGYNRKRKATRSNPTSEPVVDQAAVTTTTTTLQLLPERDVGFVGSGSQWGEDNERDVERRKSEVALASDPKRGAVEVWVTVECATEACMDVEVGCTDEERKRNLEEDTCPGFVSDGVDRVEWVNKAFRRMVRQRQRSSDNEAGEEIEVRLITKPRVRWLRRVFTCQVKVQFKAGTEMVVPCDAWRMDGGGIAWKLDVKAALTLAPPFEVTMEGEG